MPPDPNDAEVISKTGNTDRAHVTNGLLNVRHLGIATRLAEENLVQVGRRKVFDRGQFQPMFVGLGFDARQVLCMPDPVVPGR